jgi:hypothetical protein
MNIGGVVVGRQQEKKGYRAHPRLSSEVRGLRDAWRKRQNARIWKVIFALVTPLLSSDNKTRLFFRITRRDLQMLGRIDRPARVRGAVGDAGKVTTIQVRPMEPRSVVRRQQKAVI